MASWFLPLGLAILLAGLVTLLKPGAVRALLGIPAGDAATYALRIAGMMITAFGLTLASFALAYSLSAPAAGSSSQGA